MRRLPDARLLRVSKATKREIAAWVEGKNLSDSAAATIADLEQDVCVHRYRLARLHFSHGNQLLRNTAPSYRGAISRYYYSIYNGLRACAYIYHHGDDHEQHSDLPKHLPRDFPNVAQWQNALKDAREIRNRADYDPYPRRHSSFQTDAMQLSSNASGALPLVKSYLQSKGCHL